MKTLYTNQWTGETFELQINATWMKVHGGNKAFASRVPVQAKQIGKSKMATVRWFNNCRIEERTVKMENVRFN